MYLILFFRNDLLITPLALFIFTAKFIHLFRSTKIPQREQTVHLYLCFHTFCNRINTPLPYKPHKIPGSLCTQNVLYEAFDRKELRYDITEHQDPKSSGQIQHRHHAHGKPKTTLKHSFNIRKSSHPLIQYFFLRRNNRPTDSILLMKYANGIISPFAMC